MSNRVVRRYGGTAVSGSLRSASVGVLAAAFVAVLPPGPLAAQVGHDPTTSPFRDVNTRQSVVLLGGHWFGNKSEAGVGAQAGPMAGIKLRTALSGPLDLIISSVYVQSQRNTINTLLPDSTRNGGPIDYNMIITDLSLGLTLTGAKTWHGLAPYLSAGFGFVIPTNDVVDPGGFHAGSGFTFTPAFGIRMKLSNTFGLQFEGADHTIRYEWPPTYFFPKDATGTAITPPVLDPAKSKNTQVTHNFTLSLGLSYNFNF